MEVLNKTEKLNRILDIVRKKNISAYSIAKGTGISEAGIGKILNKSSKNPQKTTVDTIYRFLFSEEKPKSTGEFILFRGDRIPVSEWVYITVENDDLLMKYESYRLCTENKVLKRMLELKDSELKEYLKKD